MACSNLANNISWLITSLPGAAGSPGSSVLAPPSEALVGGEHNITSKPMLRSLLVVTRLIHALPTGGLSQTRPNDQATPALSTGGLSQARPSDLSRSETLSH